MRRWIAAVVCFVVLLAGVLGYAVFRTPDSHSAQEVPVQQISSLTLPPTLEVQSNVADAVFTGVVVKLEPARWNNPDGSGKEWTEEQKANASETEDLIILYRPYRIKVTEVLRGEDLKAGATVSLFMLEGVTEEGRNDGPPHNGDKVVVLGTLSTVGGDHTVPKVRPGVAYWAIADLDSVWVERGDGTFLAYSEIEQERSFKAENADASVLEARKEAAAEKGDTYQYQAKAYPVALDQLKQILVQHPRWTN